MALVIKLLTVVNVNQNSEAGTYLLWLYFITHMQLPVYNCNTTILQQTYKYIAK